MTCRQEVTGRGERNAVRWLRCSEGIQDAARRQVKRPNCRILRGNDKPSTVVRKGLEARDRKQISLGRKASQGLCFCPHEINDVALARRQFSDDAPRFDVHDADDVVL